MKTPLGGVRRLSNAEMLRVHETMLAILCDPGLRIELPDWAFEKLGAAGASTQPELQRVCLAPDLVQETVRQFAGATTAQITEEGTDRPPQPLRLPTRIRGRLGTTHGFVFDVDQWRVRSATLDDAQNFMKIRKSLKGVEPNGVGMLPQDVPAEVAYVHRAALSAKYDERPSGEANGPHDGPWVTRVLQAAGALAPDAPPAASVHIQPTAALCVEGRVAEDMLDAVQSGRLTVILPCGFLGGNHPVTMPGALAQVYAEIFGFNTIVRLLADPPNNVYSPRSIGCDHLTMDLRRGAFTGGTPEALHMRAGMRQMSGAFYKFPGGTGYVVGNCTDAKVPGIQAAMEHALLAMGELMSGFYSCDEEVTAQVKIIGRLHANLCLCAEQALIDHEMLQWLARSFRGVEVDDETLALDGIREVGPGGAFTSSQHTLRNYREHLWFPTLLHRGAWADWEASGARDPLDIAREQVKEILRQELVPAIPDDLCHEVNKVVQEAETALLGEPTGIVP